MTTKDNDDWLGSILVGAVGLAGLVAASLFMNNNTNNNHNNTQGNSRTLPPPPIGQKPGGCGCQHSKKT